MTEYAIKKGEIWADPRDSRLRFASSLWSFNGRMRLTTPKRDEAGQYTGGITDVGNTHIKLGGLIPVRSIVSPVGRMREGCLAELDRLGDGAHLAPLRERFTAGFKGAYKQFAATSHTESYRLIGYWRHQIHKGLVTRWFEVKLYIYKDCRGPVFGTRSDPKHGMMMAYVPEDYTTAGETEPFSLTMWVDGRSMVFSSLDQHGRLAMQRRVEMTHPFRHFAVAGAHANNGPSSPSAPCDLAWRATIDAS